MAEQLIVLLTVLISLAFLIWLAREAKFLNWDFKRWKKKDALTIFLALAASKCIVHLGMLGLNYFNIKSTANDQALNQIFGGFSFPVSFLIIAVFNPIMEEIIFRAGIMTYVCGKKPVLGLILSSLIFGAVHMPTNLFSWFIYSGIGFVLAFTYYKTKRLELPIAIHILHNVLAVTLF
ncbi:CPBP family intramembrane glutamic endopeptidase [Streptococcus dentiloxodontae]